MFLASASYLSLSGALDYWYTATHACVPDGPNFDMTYFITYSSIVGSIFGTLGIMLFQSTMSKWHFRPLFWVTTVLRCAAAFVDIIIVKRWSHDAGIPDKVMYMLGNQIVATVVSMLDWMPGIVLTSKLCPKHMESTVYAMLAGFQNFGQSIAATLGVALTSAMKVEFNPDDDVCEYENLPMLIAISHMILPLCVIPLTFILIPDLRMTDSITVNEDGRIERTVDDGGVNGGGNGDTSTDSPNRYGYQQTHKRTGSGLDLAKEPLIGAMEEDDADGDESFEMSTRA
jgi:hypothetical protein